MAQALCLVKEKDTSQESQVSGWKQLLLHGEVGPWLGRVLHRIAGPAVCTGSPVLLRLVELESLDLSWVLWTFMLPLGSRLSLSSSKCCCGFVSSLPHQIISLVLASIEEESSWLYQASCRLTRVVL